MQQSNNRKMITQRDDIHSHLLDLIPSQFNSVEDYASSLLQFLNEWKQFFQYETATDHVILFFRNNHYQSRVPQEWQSVLKHASTSELIHMARNGVLVDDGDKWPQSLKQFVSDAKALYMKPKSTTVDLINNNNNNSASHHQQQQQQQQEADCSSLTGEIVRGMSRKKQYEVERLAKLIASYATSNGCDSVLDIGSGKGYLSHVLAFNHDLNVLAVDHNEMVVQKSQSRSDKMGKLFDKKVCYKAISSHLTTDEADFERLMSQTEHMHDSTLCLIGLHTCGDLAPATMNMFLAHKRAKCMVNVGCCYHKVTESEDVVVSNSYGYPLSSFITNKGGLRLTNGGKVLACAALDKWNTADAAINNFKRNAHRCALEAFLHCHQGQPSICGADNASPIVYCIGSIPSHFSTFERYAAHAIQVMKSKDQIQDESLLKLSENPEALSLSLKQFYETLGPNSDERIATLDAYWSIRAILGPLLESLIIIDRYLFLKEKGVSVDVMRIFDGELSPRNMILLACKREE